MHQRLLRHMIAETEVPRPDGQTMLVRIMRNGPIVGLFDLALGRPDLVSSLDFLRKNLARAGDTGWAVLVVRPESKWGAARTLFRQPVNAASLVVDIAEVVHEAVRRGDRLWGLEDED